MATVGRANNASYLNTARLSYISTAPFNNNFFTYTTIINSQGTTVGVFTAVSGATVSNCPAGRVLRETGRKIYPGANPMPAGYNTYMVSVYDQQTQLTGFIDPNSSVWCIYNTDKPNFWPDGVDPTSQVTDAGLSIYTLGNVTSQGFISTASYLNVAGNALVVGNTSTLGSAMVAGNLSTIGNVTAGGYVYARSGLGFLNLGDTYTQPAGLKSNTVTGDAPTGYIAMEGTQVIGVGDTVSFTFNNSSIASGDMLQVYAIPLGAANFDWYAVAGYCTAGSCRIFVRNINPINLVGYGPVIKYVVFKSGP